MIGSADIPLEAGAVREYFATVRSGVGGATKAFCYANGRRIEELRQVLGFEPFPGSLNLKLDRGFDWEQGYRRARILDVLDRQAGLSSHWHLRVARFAPLEIEGERAFAFRFDGDRYSARFLELVAPVRLRDVLQLSDRQRVRLCRL